MSALTSLLLSTPAHAEPQTTAPAGKTYYISATGADANDGVSERTPFASLSKLNSVLSAGDIAKFRCGDTFFGTLKPRESGTQAARVAIGCYGAGAKPLITGFKTITTWTALEGGLYEAVLDPAPTGQLEMLRFDGRIQPKGRLPKAGKGWTPGSDADSWFEIKSHKKNVEITTADAIPNVTGGEIVQKKYQWIIDRGHIDRISSATIEGQQVTTIQVSEYPVLHSDPYDALDRNGFFVQNHIKCLTEPGDWSYDPASRKLTVFFGDQPPRRHQVEAACLDHVVNLTNRGHIRLDNLAIVGSNSDLVKLDAPINTTGKCDHVSLNNCDLSFAGRDGVAVAAYRLSSFATDAPDGSITHCTLSNINNNAITLHENPRWTITGNTIDQVALHEGLQQSGDGQAIGIFSVGTEGLVQRNEISHVGYSGIYFSGSGVQIRNNHVHHFCLIKSDGGGIYTYGGEERKVHSRPRIIDGNIVHDGLGAREGVHSKEANDPYAPQSQGIYMDGNATDVIITHNTAFRNATAGLWLGSNSNIVVYGNLLADNHTTQLQIDDQKSRPTKLDIHDNILFAFEREQLCITLSLPQKPADQTQLQYIAGIGKLADNRYCRPIQEPDDISTSGYIHCNDGGLGHDPDKSYTNYHVANDYPAGGVVSLPWASTFLSLDRWQKQWGQDAGTKMTGRSVAKLSDLRLEYNATGTSVTQPLPGVFEDAKGTIYKQTITLPPYGSAVLMRMQGGKG